MRKWLSLGALMLLTACSSPDLSELDTLKNHANLSQVVEFSFEYGEALDLENLKFEVLKYSRTIEDFTLEDIDTDQEILEIPTSSGSVQVQLKMEDTQFPVMEGKSKIEIYEGDKLDLSKHITASDPVDGKLEVSFSSVDVNKVGEHKGTATAKDKNGNESTMDFVVLVKEKVVSAPVYTPKPSGNNSNSKPSTTPPESVSSYSAQVQEMHALVNAARKRNGLPALSLNDRLSRSAVIRSKEIQKSFSHTRPGGGNALSMDGKFISGENISYGYNSAQEAVDGFMGSAGHRKNILKSNFTKVGYALYIHDGVWYWVQLFGY